MGRRRWWEQWWFLAAIVLLSAVPLLLPWTPPMPDVPGHIGRYRVEVDWQSSASLRQFFSFHWALVGNLGIDLLVIPLASIFGLELAVKLIVLTIPPLTILGLFFISREIHGRVPPTTLFAVPFVYGYPFNFGFINFALSMALAFLALGYWLRLERQGRLRLRAALFVPISCAVWVVHAFGWGALGLMAFSTELVRQHDDNRNWPKSIASATFHMLPLALPLALTLMWRVDAVGGAVAPTDHYFDIGAKLFAIAATLRDRWLLWDALSVAPAILLIGAAIFDRQLKMSRRLAMPAAILALIYCALPGRMFGAAYADMRLVPFTIMLAVVAVRFRDGDNVAAMRPLALMGVAFTVFRLAGNTVSFAIADREARVQLGALDQVPTGAKVLSLARFHCGEEWKLPRYSHFGSFVITRRLGFSNDQWQVAGAQLLTIHYPAAGAFDSDPSTRIYSRRCVAKLSGQMGGAFSGRSTERALAEFPREAFDFVWLIEPPDFIAGPLPGLVPIWRRGDSILYRINHSVPTEATPTVDPSPEADATTNRQVGASGGGGGRDR